MTGRRFLDRPAEPGAVVPSMLAPILAAVAHRLEARQARVSFEQVCAEAAAAAQSHPVRSLAAALKAAAGEGTARVAVIAELKRASPSRGMLCPDFDLEGLAERYREGGAAALSVLTEEDYFQGHPGYLAELRAHPAGQALPLLRKDFIFDPYQIYESRVLGADAVLLIAAVLAPPNLERLLALTVRLGMEALVEVHTEQEMDIALGAGARLLGINNRDLTTFQTDLGVTVRLAGRVPDRCFLVSESGITTAADIALVAEAGARAVLVGEALVTSDDPTRLVRRLAGRRPAGEGDGGE